MTDLTPALRKALEAVPDEWTDERRTWFDLIRDGLVEDRALAGRYEIRRTPAGRAALEQHRG